MRARCTAPCKWFCDEKLYWSYNWSIRTHIFWHWESLIWLCIQLFQVMPLICKQDIYNPDSKQLSATRGCCAAACQHTRWQQINNVINSYLNFLREIIFVNYGCDIVVIDQSTRTFTEILNQILEYVLQRFEKYKHYPEMTQLFFYRKSIHTMYFMQKYSYATNFFYILSRYNVCMLLGIYMIDQHKVAHNCEVEGN